MADFIDDDEEGDNEAETTLEVKGQPKSSARVLAAIKKAEHALNDWQGLCDRIDEIYGRSEHLTAVWLDTAWRDPEYDLFWASMEIMKPAVYARPPEPVVSPQFKDRRPLQNTTAELLERTVKSAFDRSFIDEAMIGTRDDLIFYNRGQIWLTYETDEKGGGQRICVEHLDRKDFVYSPARKWSEVPMAARRAWMTPKEMRKRFRKHSGDAYKNARISAGEGEDKENKGKAGVWEVWHKADNRVYWGAEGVNVMLDEGEPHLKLRDYFPCPRPAFGTLRPRTLIPVPDYVRYAGHFRKINRLTSRIYTLLDQVKLKVLIPAGGDIGDAVEQAIREDNDMIVIPVPAAALSGVGANGLMVTLPLADVATAITGLIEARRELFSDFDRLSGISDIMRGETEAEETLGAQQLKSQYGSVRVREKVEELQRIACDVTKIAAEIMADNFSKETFLEMSQMEIPTKSDIEKRIDAIEEAAEGELKSLMDKAKEMAEQAKAQGQEIDPAQAKQQFDQAQQQIIQKYSQRLKMETEAVPLEDVMKLLRDDKARGFAFEIATDSTILQDESQEKASRNEFLGVFTGAVPGFVELASLGDAAAKLAGGVLKFALQPYRVGRELNGLVDDFIDAAPQMAAQAQAGEGGDTEALVEAQNKLAEAEIQKAKAATMNVEARAANENQKLQAKIMEMQQKAANDQQKAQLEVSTLQGKLAEQDAKINLMQAQTAEILNKIGLDVRKQDLEEYQASAEVQLRSTDQAINAQNSERDAELAERGEMRADREQVVGEEQGARSEERADRQQDFSERSTDRQMTLAERQAEREGAA